MAVLCCHEWQRNVALIGAKVSLTEVVGRHWMEFGCENFHGRKRGHNGLGRLRCAEEIRQNNRRLVDAMLLKYIHSL